MLFKIFVYVQVYVMESIMDKELVESNVYRFVSSESEFSDSSWFK